MPLAVTSSVLSFSQLRWWQALNPAIYLISFLPLFSFLRFFSPADEIIIPLVFCDIGVIFLQHGINVLNDLTDWKRGADLEKYDSWVVYHKGQLEKVKVHGIMSLAVGTMIGLFVLWEIQKLELLLFALPLVLLGVLYNHEKNPLSYTRHSEWVTGLCYGPGVCGSLWYVSGVPFSPSIMIFLIAFTSLSVCVLLAHQPPQVLTDTLVGKRSYAVRNGVAKTKVVSKSLSYLALLCFLGMIFYSNNTTLNKMISSLSFVPFISLLKAKNFGPVAVLKFFFLGLGVGFLLVQLLKGLV